MIKTRPGFDSDKARLRSGFQQGALRSDSPSLRQDGSGARRQVPSLVLQTADVVHLTVVIVLVGDQMPQVSSDVLSRPGRADGLIKFTGRQISQ